MGMWADDVTFDDHLVLFAHWSLLRLIHYIDRCYCIHGPELKSHTSSWLWRLLVRGCLCAARREFIYISYITVSNYFLYGKSLLTHWILHYNLCWFLQILCNYSGFCRHPLILTHFHVFRCHCGMIITKFEHARGEQRWCHRRPKTKLAILLQCHRHSWDRARADEMGTQDASLKHFVLVLLHMHIWTHALTHDLCYVDVVVVFPHVFTAFSAWDTWGGNGVRMKLRRHWACVPGRVGEG